mgnify:CR=1 FL=1
MNNSSLYSEFLEGIEKRNMDQITYMALKVLEKENVIVNDKIAIVRAKKDVISNKNMPLLLVELYLGSGWKVSLTVNPENKVFIEISRGCRNE